MHCTDLTFSWMHVYAQVWLFGDVCSAHAWLTRVHSNVMDYIYFALFSHVGNRDHAVENLMQPKITVEL